MGRACEEQAIRQINDIKLQVFCVLLHELVLLILIIPFQILMSIFKSYL